MGACCGSELDSSVGMRRDTDEEREDESSRPGARGSPATASMYSQQGCKGINQDSMIIWEDFAGDEDSTFYGVFDGHGPLGHRVSWLVRDSLPPKLQKAMESPSKDLVQEANADAHAHADAVSGDLQVQEWFCSWQTCLEKAFAEMDNELGDHPTIDCICSGATAVTVLRQKEYLIIANLGDSRAVLCTRDKNHLVPVQLTVDHKPNVRSEAERITTCNGRVFSIEEEPDVHRVWLPDEDCPGLAMARAFGDFCLKDFGLISTPQISYRKLSDKDVFIVLATDGIWDVLSNKEVIKIVSSASKKPDAAKHLVKRAVRAWRSKFPTSKVDDCTAVCLFLKPPREGSRSGGRSYSSLSNTESSEAAAAAQQEKQEDLTASDSMVRWNTMTKKDVPRLQLAKRPSRRNTESSEAATAAPQEKQEDWTASDSMVRWNPVTKKDVPGLQVAKRPSRRSTESSEAAAGAPQENQEDWTASDSMVRRNPVTKKDVPGLQLAKRPNRRKTSLKAEESR